MTEDAASSAEIDLSIVVPTYREAENIPLLMRGIRDALDYSRISYEVVIVDDNSPDNTGEVCSAIAREGMPLRLVVRANERGLSSAVLRGFRAARGRWLCCMDADLSHPPSALPALREKMITDQADIAIGSRYVPGGKTYAEWGLFRWLNSKVATLLAAPLAGRVHDPMAGYFMLSRETFARCNELNPIGYKILLEIIVKSDATRIVEVPIEFRDRTFGQSKLSMKEQLRYLNHLYRLYAHLYPSLAHFMAFAAIGASGMLIDLTVVYAVQHMVSAPFAAARAAGIVAGIAWNFLGNRHFTFATHRADAAWLQFLKFALSCLTGAAVNMSTSICLHRYLWPFQGWPLRSALAGVFAGTAFNFVCARSFAFRK
jgi:dolichol-phosphate mannosyltransferase